MAAVAAVVAVAALIVALTNARPAAAPATTSLPTYTAAETAAAQRQLCDTYKLAAHAVEVDTGGNNRALARIADTNGAVMLDCRFSPLASCSDALIWPSCIVSNQLGTGLSHGAL
ncbi:hypothetical protein MSHI_35050 [Mycobacterium shinjukuense]|uniref:Uncharacterized protein n=1 Tax=Mycobacterium shinjukuense TaxID=398694 RepID=A0A7I7MWM9_9MYCO|nr:hypothetical protein MSHI_35050 [Mycobacterium shinjukuense]